jgi:tetratricopeptide (TPR) repeat protein/tRNA A-37 threonylcarbamoyl transferase component Bud32
MPTDDEYRVLPGPAPGARPDDPATTTGPTVADPDRTGEYVPLVIVPGYEILGEVGRGGMGVVYKARDPAVNRHVAVKVLQKRHRKSPSASARFVEEGQITGQMQHPGVPAVHQIGALPDGSPFLAMKLIKGDTLADRLAAPSPDRGALVAVFLQVAQAVGYAHSKGVIHRDLKPANVMVGQFGEVQVMDWGLAKVLSQTTPGPTPEPNVATTRHSLVETDRSSDPGSYTQAGSVLGTPAYMSPEQAGGEIDKLDERADVFGLGAVLCEILTGDPPYRDRTADAVRLRAVRGQLDDGFGRLDGCGADPELVALCKRCLAPDRDVRPRNAGEVAAAVSAHLAAVEGRLRQAEQDRAAAEARAAEEANTRRVAEEKAAEQRKRRRWQVAVAGAGVLMLALLGAGAWWADRQEAERRTEREKDRAVAAEQNRQEAVALLAQAEEALAAGNLPVAEVALAQAEGHVGADAPDDLRDRLAVARRDRDFVRDLREIEDLSWMPGNIGMADPAAMAGRYRAAFARYGLDVAGTEPGAAADVVRASRVSAALVSGLGQWSCTDPGQPHLRQLLDRLDPDPARMAVRAAIQAGDENQVRGLVGALDGSNVPAWFAASVGFLRVVPFEDGVRLMAAAWRAHPADYLLAYRIGQRLWGTRDDRLPEMLAWARVAVSLRPESPFPLTLLSTAWRALRNWPDAEATARRAIELGRKYPKYAGAHVCLGNVLLEKGDFDGAEASYRAALAIDPGSAGIYYNLGLVHRRRGDLAGAEEWYRKAATATPTRAYFKEVLDDTVRMRARLEEVVAGRADPATPAEAVEFAELVSRPARRRYALAVRLYGWAFAANPALADDLPSAHRYNAARCAVLAAAGQDEEVTAFGVEEWGYLTGLALKWLRADLARLSRQAKDPKLRQEVRERLTHWKSDPDLASVRDRAWLVAMPPGDRKAWESLWADVDALLAATSPDAAPPRPKG